MNQAGRDQAAVLQAIADRAKLARVRGAMEAAVARREAEKAALEAQFNLK